MPSRLILSLLLAAACANAMAAVAVDGEGIFSADTEITQPVTGDLFRAGGKVTLSAPVEGKVRIAAGRVEIAPGGTVSKGAALAGGKVIVRGAVAGDLRAAGGHVTIDAPVSGNATIAAGTLELGPNARIGGKLSYRAENFERDPAAQVAGGVVRSARSERKWRGDGPASTAARVAWTLGLMLLAAVIAGALPGPVRRMQEELRTRPWLASLTGIVTLICIPIAALLVMITVIGIPLGLLGLFAYLALLLVGYVSTSVVVSGLLLDRYKADVAARTAWRVGAAVLAMLAIALLARIPVVGGMVALASLVVGVGVIVATMMHRRPQAATATA